MQVARAYYDGNRIALHDPLEMKKNDELLITVLTPEVTDGLEHDIEQAFVSDIGSDDFLTKEELEYYLSLQ